MRKSVRAKKKTPAVSPDPYFSRAVAKAFQAVDEITHHEEPMQLHELASKLGLTKPSAFRILHTLESLGYVTRGAEGYSAPALPQVPARTIRELLRHAPEPLRALALETGETASLAAVFENHIEVVLVVESPQLIRMANTLGRIIPPHASSLGKAITAFQTDDNRYRLLRSYGIAQFTPTTVTDELALNREFEAIRQQGFAEDREESTPGAACFGCPILRTDGTALGSISVSMPKMRFNGESHQKQLVAAVKKAAAVITKRLSAQ